MVEWTKETIAEYDRIIKMKTDRKAQIRQMCGWSEDLHVGLYTVDMMLPTPNYSGQVVERGNRPSLRRKASQLSHQRHTHKKEENK